MTSTANTCQRKKHPTRLASRQESTHPYFWLIGLAIASASPVNPKRPWFRRTSSTRQSWFSQRHRKSTVMGATLTASPSYKNRWSKFRMRPLQSNYAMRIPNFIPTFWTVIYNLQAAISTCSSTRKQCSAAILYSRLSKTIKRYFSRDASLRTCIGQGTPSNFIDKPTKEIQTTRVLRAGLESCRSSSLMRPKALLNPNGTTVGRILVLFRRNHRSLISYSEVGLTTIITLTLYRLWNKLALGVIFGTRLLRDFRVCFAQRSFVYSFSLQ